MDFNWHWNYKPIYDLGYNIVGIDRLGNMRLDRNHSYHQIKYKDLSEGVLRGTEYSSIDIEGLTSSAKCTFKFHKDINDCLCWAYEGSGNFQLTMLGKLNDLVMFIKYGYSFLEDRKMEYLNHLYIHEYLINHE